MGKKYKVSFITNDNMEQEAAELKEFLALQQAEGNISDLTFEEWFDDVMVGA